MLNYDESGKLLESIGDSYFGACLVDFIRSVCAISLTIGDEFGLVPHLIHFGSRINKAVVATLVIDMYDQRAVLLILPTGEIDYVMGCTRKYFQVDDHDIGVSYLHAYINDVGFVLTNDALLSGIEVNIYGNNRQNLEGHLYVPSSGAYNGRRNLMLLAIQQGTIHLMNYLMLFFMNNIGAASNYMILVGYAHNLVHI